MSPEARERKNAKARAKRREERRRRLLKKVSDQANNLALAALRPTLPLDVQASIFAAEAHYDPLKWSDVARIRAAMPPPPPPPPPPRKRWFQALLGYVLMKS